MEPIMKVDVICPEEFMGTVVGDISSRRGIMSEMGDRGNMKTVTATIPLSQMFQYVSDLRSMTKGRAQYSMTFDKYDFVPGDIEKEICKKFQPAGGGDDDYAQDRQSNIVSMSALVLLIGFVASGSIFIVLKSSRLRSSSSTTVDQAALLEADNRL